MPTIRICTAFILIPFLFCFTDCSNKKNNNISKVKSADTTYGNNKNKEVDSSDLDKKNEINAHDTSKNNLPITIQTSPLIIYSELVKKYADSLNNWSTNKKLPIFINDISIDEKFGFFGTDLHHPHSIRKAIIDSVKNVEVLYRILKTNDPNYQKKPCEYYDEVNLSIPFCDYSLKDLVKLKLKNLRN